MMFLTYCFFYTQFLAVKHVPQLCVFFSRWNYPSWRLCREPQSPFCWWGGQECPFWEGAVCPASHCVLQETEVRAAGKIHSDVHEWWYWEKSSPCTSFHWGCPAEGAFFYIFFHCDLCFALNLVSSSCSCIGLNMYYCHFLKLFDLNYFSSF